MFEDLYAGFNNQIQEFSSKRFISPTINSISILAKEDLAVLAESIVELQALKKQVSLEVATVGGPIDVAVISKHDGFIWIKRKLYFDSKLNYCFEQNYFKR